MLRHLLYFMADNDGEATQVCYFVSDTLRPSALINSYRQRHYLLSIQLTFSTRYNRWSLGSLLFLSSWAAMMGPWTYAKHLISQPRLPFTATYFGSIILTLYFSLGLHSTILTLFSSLVQLVCLIWYLVSYFPMGSSGLRLAASFGTQRATSWMNG
ncbi:hypothetical protein HI914_05757 [Erysiphe necator]|nr:hypothetical protein HI914_05757 [Erysiphe necator]